MVASIAIDESSLAHAKLWSMKRHTGGQGSDKG